MERNTRIFILVVGGVLLAGSIGLGVYLHLRNKKKEEEEKELEEIKAEQEQQQKAQSAATPTVDSGMIVPTFNAEKELTNPFMQLKGRYLYPKRREQGGQGYSNIRTSAIVNTDQGWWDPSDNLITTINSGVPIGKVTGEVSGLHNNYSYRWFKVDLNKKVEGWFSDYTKGYVRADTVTFKPYSK